MSKQHSPSMKEEGVSRRRFIGLTFFGSIVVTIGGVLTPIIAYLWPPAGAASGSNLKVRVGSVDEFPPETGAVVSVENRPIIVVNTEQAGLKVFSAVCTHLGCIVYWNEQRGVIQCPCHDGRFNPLNGQVLFGPPPAPLAEHRLEVNGHSVFVSPSPLADT